jgi:hypothetical protein
VQAILYYGSCWRGGDEMNGLVDLYVVVDSYRQAYPAQRWLGVLNWLLPPNVFYLEAATERGVVRAKYAVLSWRDLRRGTSVWFHSYLWGRFAQPTALIYARDEGSRQQVVQALAQAVVTLLIRALPCAPACFSADELWQAALALSYQAELRNEPAGRARQLVANFADYYTRITPLVLAETPYRVTVAKASDGYCVGITPHRRHLGRIGWGLRRVQGKLLSLARLSKAVFTFQGGVDYIVWKLERHTGVAIEVSPQVRRYPLVYGWGLLWRLYRRGVFR